MVTQLKERQGIVKCDCYWPDHDVDDPTPEESPVAGNRPAFLGDNVAKPVLVVDKFQIVTESETLSEHFVVRDLMVTSVRPFSRPSPSLLVAEVLD